MDLTEFEAGAEGLEMEILKKVHETAQRVLGTDELAKHWLTHPAMALDGKRPIDLLTTESGINTVKDLLIRLEYNIYT
jgi:putative toxin-antitoxin system antitoxin component (TIGR02293 family)